MVRRIAEQGAWVFGISSLLAISPHVPQPAGYATAIIAMILGPGHGLPQKVFGEGYLSSPEQLLLTVLSSICLNVIVLYVIVIWAPPLSGATAGLVVIALTAASSLVNIGSSTAAPSGSGNLQALARLRRLVFAVGIVAGLLLGAFAWRVVGL